MCELEINLVTVVLIWSGVKDTLGSVCEEWSPSIFNLWLVRFVRDRCLNIPADVTKLSRSEERPLDKQPSVERIYINYSSVKVTLVYKHFLKSHCRNLSFFTVIFLVQLLRDL